MKTTDEYNRNKDPIMWLLAFAFGGCVGWALADESALPLIGAALAVAAIFWRKAIKQR
ncbi:MAG: hypothetical protein AAF668_15990 [Pseudomonadota bacterium]